MSTPEHHFSVTINRHGYIEKIFSQNGWAAYVQDTDETDADTVDGIERLVKGEANGRVTLQHFEVRCDENGLAGTNEYGRREALRLSSIESVVVTSLTVEFRTATGAFKYQDVPAVQIRLATGRVAVQMFLGARGWDVAYRMFDAVETLIAAN